MTESWTDPLFYRDGRGKLFRANRGLKENVHSQNRVLRSSRYGSEREPMNWFQGSKSKGSLSGNTHAGWDAYDRSPHNTKRRSKCARIHGCMDHHRTPQQGPWVSHGHVGVDGGAGSDALMGQLGEYHHDQDGLRGNGRDLGFEMRNTAGNRIFPLYVGSWRPKGKHGIYVCTIECGAYEYQSSASDRLLDIALGQELSISAVTAVVNSSGKHYWGITDTKGSTPGGEVVLLDNFRLVKEVPAL